MKINAFSALITAVTQPKTKYAVIGSLATAVTAVAAKYIVATKNNTIKALQNRVKELEMNQPRTLIIGNGNAKGLRPSQR